MSGLTQTLLAKEGKITEQMKRVAVKEGRSEEFIRERVADGRIVIPANINHKNLEPVGIGRELLTKINANIGNSSLSSCPKEEQTKLQTALKYGADTVMDLSNALNITKISARIFLQNAMLRSGRCPYMRWLRARERTASAVSSCFRSWRSRLSRGLTI